MKNVWLKIFLLLLVPAICQADSMNFTILCENQLAIEATINSEVVDFSFFEDLRLFKRFPHIEGTIKVSNISKQEQCFSTGNCLLSGKGMEKTRAYYSSITGDVIDYPCGIKLQPGEEVVVKVYWVTNLEIGKELEKPKLYCQSLGSD